VTDPPEFAWRGKEYQLPPDVTTLRDLGPILARFYKEANIEELWQRSQPAYEQAMARQQEQAIRAVTEVSGYLRAPLTGTYMGRQFKVVVDLLGAPNQIHFRPYLDDYYLVLTHSNENHFNDIRQAYLHYLIDPLVTKYADDIDKKKAVGDYAQAAPYLAEHYKSDFLLLFTRSLIRAIEARLGPSSKRQAAIQEAMGEGYILAGHFSEQLVAYEKQETAMRMYFPELVQTIDFKREERRLEGIQFSAKRPEGKIIRTPPPPPPDQSPAEKSLDAAEELYKKQNWDKARETFARVLSETQQNPLQARAYYGLARIAALKKDPETAVQLFEKGLKLGPPPFERAWMLVYLGRLSIAAGKFADAGEQFQQAIAVEGGSDKAREAARIGLAQIAQQTPK
jgi:tetratricopeptide (TPR) repeat protein